MTLAAASRRRLLHRAQTLRPATAPRDGWLVLSPHPDDETLGAGGLIAALASANVPVCVALLTDGAASHVGAPGWSARRVAAVRAQEARAALRQLGLQAPPITLGWQDAAPFEPGSPRFEESVAGLVTLCRRRGLRHVVATWAGDPHCDHEAAAGLATEVARRLRVRPLFYLVWGWTRTDLDTQLAGMRVWALPVARWRAAQRRALSCHRTQLGGRIAGAPDAFVLPRAMRRLVDAPHTLLLEPRHAA